MAAVHHAAPPNIARSPDYARRVAECKALVDMFDVTCVVLSHRDTEGVTPSCTTLARVKAIGDGVQPHSDYALHSSMDIWYNQSPARGGNDVDDCHLHDTLKEKGVQEMVAFEPVCTALAPPVASVTLHVHPLTFASAVRQLVPARNSFASTPLHHKGNAIGIRPITGKGGICAMLYLLSNTLILLELPIFGDTVAAVGNCIDDVFVMDANMLLLAITLESEHKNRTACPLALQFTIGQTSTMPGYHRVSISAEDRAVGTSFGSGLVMTTTTTKTTKKRTEGAPIAEKEGHQEGVATN